MATIMVERWPHEGLNIVQCGQWISMDDLNDEAGQSASTRGAQTNAMAACLCVECASLTLTRYWASGLLGAALLSSPDNASSQLAEHMHTSSARHGSDVRPDDRRAGDRKRPRGQLSSRGPAAHDAAHRPCRRTLCMSLHPHILQRHRPSMMSLVRRCCAVFTHPVLAHCAVEHDHIEQQQEDHKLLLDQAQGQAQLSIL